MPEWQVCSTAPGAAGDPAAVEHLAVEWHPAIVPGTAASALRAMGRWSLDDELDFDAEDWWWRASFVVERTGDQWQLAVDGVATVADVWFDGQVVLHSEQMFLRHVVEVGELAAGSHEVYIRCAALAPLLTAKRPRPRWRTRLVKHQNLRWYRTTLLGRIPGWSPTGAAVGPWRGVELRPAPDITRSSLRATCDGGDGVVDVQIDVRDASVLAGKRAVISVGDSRADATVDGTRVTASVHVRTPERWWPHTHGVPHRYDVTLLIDELSVPLGHVGFRTVDVITDDGAFELRINGVRVFCRGASWMPVDPVSLAAGGDALREALLDVRRGNMNMLRVNGTTVYETDEFYDLCDELGILVWQDAMFASMDPPDDPAFINGVESEVSQLLARIGHRPSLTVFCGGSELEQQAAMLGLPRDRWIMPLFHEVLPALVASSVPGLPYVTSSPTGGALPFHNDAGVAHYFGVGAYRRPLSDARRAGVRFATECLAFSNVPDSTTLDRDLGGVIGIGHTPVWKRGVPRDSGTSWDFEDIRDHYVRELFAVEPGELRGVDAERYLALGRVTTAEVMSATFAEWRRSGSTCAGGLIWFLRDLRPGAGWGVIDSAGRRKPAWWYLRRVLAPVVLLPIDEGLNGLHLHAVNDTAERIDGAVRVELFTRGELRTEVAEIPFALGPRATQEIVADTLFEGFRDLTWAYRFGPAGYDVVVATLLDGAGQVLSRAVHLPLGLSRTVEPDLGIDATATPAAGGAWTLTVRARRFAQSAVIDVDGFAPDDNWLHLVPGTEHTVALTPTDRHDRAPSGEIRPLNALTASRIQVAS